MRGILTLLSQTAHSCANRFFLYPGKYILGRSSRCELRVKDKTISREHAEIEVYEPEAMLVRDLRSSNGTYVDSARVDTRIVRVGQHIRFGRIAYLVFETPVHAGEMINSDAATDDCDEDLENLDGHASGHALSAAQQRIYALAMEGLTEKQIAIRVCLSCHTIHNHLRAIYRAFRVHSRQALIVQHHQRIAGLPVIGLVIQ